VRRVGSKAIDFPLGGFSPPEGRLAPWFQTTGFQPFSLSVGGEVRRKLLNPPAFSWWSFSFMRFHGVFLGNRHEI
jgi:hypothetical protein